MANANTRQARKTNPKPQANPANAMAVQGFESRVVSYKPLGELETIELTVGMVRNTLAVKSKSGKVPGDHDIIKYMMLCKSRNLNPFVGDSYLLGYDNSDGTTQWSLITAVQALLKRAEINPNYDGCENGVILKVASDDGGTTIEEREGAMVFDGEILLGGWAKVYRKDRKIPTKSAVKFSTYNTGRSRWQKDPAGMICKVAKAAALREAFPSEVGGLYLREEFDESNTVDAVGSTPQTVGTAPRQLGDLTQQLAAAAEQRDQTAIDAQDSMSVDQSGPEDDGAQAPADAADDGPMEMSREESEEMERLMDEQQGRTGTKQKTAFDTAPGYDQQ